MILYILTQKNKERIYAKKLLKNLAISNFFCIIAKMK